MDEPVKKVGFGTKIDDIDVSVRLKNVLKNMGCRNIGDVCMKTRDDIVNSRFIGRKGLMELEEFLESNGLRFCMKSSDFPSLEQLEVELGYITTIADMFISYARDVREIAYELYRLENEIRKRYLKD